ncbi:MAG: SH3 domain-containing protein [Bacteroidetes bacterium]|nr:SH3 domain-containing protein [Bacteroidota bacterium]
MQSKSELKLLPVEELEALAKSFGIEAIYLLTKGELIDLILEKNNENQYSSFISEELNKSIQPNENASELISNQPEDKDQKEDEKDQSGSAFILENPKEELSGFITPETQKEELSGFITPEAQKQEVDDLSGFIQETDGSTFIGNEEGSIFVNASAQEISNTSIIALNLTIGNKIKIQEESYEIIDIISPWGKSLEAAIYKIQTNTGRIKVIKLYKEQKNPELEPNGSALNKIIYIEDENILPLFAFGVGERKLIGKHCFEISAYAEGGNLLMVENFKNKYTYAFIKDHVIREVFNGLKRLHHHGIIHCDIKPHNIFFIDKDQTNLVIGDYGSARTLKENIAGVNHSQPEVASKVIGTNYYLAPEQHDRIISEKNDYYSLGMVLIHLLYPEQFANENDFRKVDPEKVNTIKLRIYDRGRKMLDFNPEFQDVNYLIEGLIQQNLNDRWGENEVEAWIEGNPVQIGSNKKSSIKIDVSTELSSFEDLVNYIKTADDWYENLISDKQGNDAFLAIVADRKGLLEKRKFYDQIIRQNKNQKKYLKEGIIRYLEPDAPIVINEKPIYLSPGNIKIETARLFEQLDLIWKNYSFDKVIFHFFQLESKLKWLLHHKADSQAQKEINIILKRIADVLEIEYYFTNPSLTTHFHRAFEKLVENQPVENAYYKLVKLFYQFNPTRTFRDLSSNPISNTKEIGMYFIQHKSTFLNKYLIAERKAFAEHIKHKDLSDSTYEEFLFTIFAKKCSTLIDIKNLDLTNKRQFEIKYTFRQTLKDWLKKNNLSLEVSRTLGSTKLLKHKQHLFESTKSIFRKTYNSILKKHDIEKSSLSSTAEDDLKRGFIKQARILRFGLHLKEWYASALITIPVLFLFSLFIFSNEAGVSLFKQLIRSTELDLYALNPIENNYFQGFYYIALSILFISPFILLPKLWYKSEWEFFSKNNRHFSFYLGIFMMPLLFGASNSIFEIPGIILFVLVALFLLWLMDNVKNPSTKNRIEFFAGIMLLIAITRIVLEVISWFLFEGVWTEEILPYRGLTELLPYAGSILILFIIPLFRQIFSLHYFPFLLIKSFIITLLFLLFCISDFSMGNLSKNNWFQEGIELSVYSKYIGEQTEQEVIEGYYVVELQKFEAMNVRSGPGTNYPPLETIYAEEKFMVMEIEDSNWWQVVTSSGELKGYIFAHETLNILREVNERDFE